MVSAVFEGARGTLTLLDGGAGSIDVDVDVASLTTGCAAYDEMLARVDPFDAVRHPVARFRSTRVAWSAGAAVIDGTLSAGGRSAPVTLSGTYRTSGKRTVLQAHGTIDRRALGLTVDVPGLGLLLPTRLDLHVDVHAVGCPSLSHVQVTTALPAEGGKGTHMLQVRGIGIELLTPDRHEAVLPGLAELLVDSVDGGASVGFLRGLTGERAVSWWRSFLADASMTTWIASDSGGVAGVVGLQLALQETAPHRAEVRMLLVHRVARGRGVARALLAELLEAPQPRLTLLPHARSMTLPAEDRLEIYELLALHGHLMDAGEFDRLDELFTDDFVYDLEALGYGRLEGAEALIEASRALGDANPLGHHVTNSLVTASGDDEAVVRSKGIGVLANGTSGTVVYEDVIRRTNVGWRICRRTVIPRRRPLHP